MCAGVGSGGRFRKVPECSWCEVPEGAGSGRFGGFRCVLVQVPESGSGRFRRVPAYADVGSGVRFR